MASSGRSIAMRALFFFSSSSFLSFNSLILFSLLRRSSSLLCTPSSVSRCISIKNRTSLSLDSVAAFWNCCAVFWTAVATVCAITCACWCCALMFASTRVPRVAWNVCAMLLSMLPATEIAWLEEEALSFRLIVGTVLLLPMGLA